MRFSDRSWVLRRFLDDVGKFLLVALFLLPGVTGAQEGELSTSPVHNEAVIHDGERPRRLTVDEAVFGIWYVLGVAGAGFVLFVVLFYLLYPAERRQLRSTEDDDDPETRIKIPLKP